MNNLNLIISEEDSQINFYLSNILDKLTFAEEDKIIYDLNNNSLSDIIDEASVNSLFSNIKIIIGNNFDIDKLLNNDIEYLNKYVKDINKSAYIILITNSVDARKNNYKIFKEYFNIINAAKNDIKEDINKYINKYLKDKGYKIDSVEYFLNKVSNDINNINSELNKLMIYKEEDKRITNSDIDLLISDQIDNVIYEFTNAILEDNTTEIARMYDNFKLDNITDDYLIASIANSFRQAITIKILYSEGKSNQEIAKYIGKKEFYVKKMLERLFSYTTEDLAKYINKLAQIDKNMKMSTGNEYMLELFLLDKDK